MNIMKATRELALAASTVVSTHCSEALDVLVDALLEDGKLMTSSRIGNADRIRTKLRRAAFRWAQNVTGFHPGHLSSSH